MKRFLKWMSATMVVMLLLTLPVSKVQAQDDYVSYQTFYDDLSPYGQWVYDPQYGNVWVPDAGNDFRPYYTNGYWAMTDYGNTWVSNYPWGWAPFHYGRWTYDPFYGWVWIPGNTWGPAWVSWRWGGGQCGWAPMGPGISISVSIGNYNCPSDWWVFVGPQYMYQRNFHSYWRGPRYNNTYINNTTIINNTYNNTYVYGPRANEIERVTHQRVNTHRIAQGPRGAATVNNNTLNIYRPSIRGNANDGRPRNAVEAPRALGGMQGGVRSGRTEFKQMVSRGDVKPMNATQGRGDRNNTPIRQQPGREQRFDSRDRNNNTQVRPTTNDRGRIEQMQQDRQRIDRQQMEQRQNTDRQRIEQDRQRQQIQDRQRVDRPQMQQRQNVDRQRMEQNRQRQQIQERQRIDRPQMQRQQMEQRQNMDRQRMEQRQQPQRMEQQRQQPQRMEQRNERPQQQRMEQPRPQMQRMEQRQSAPRPQPQMQRQEQRQSSPQNNPPRGFDRGGRR